MLKLDALFCLLGFLLFFIVALIAQINPPTDPQLKPAGNIITSIYWPEGSDDIDLWLSSPLDKAVAYSNKSGAVWSLLRDDLGTTKDTTTLNFENAFSRGTPDGEYAVNVRCYRCVGPVDVMVDIRMESGMVIWSGVVNLAGSKDERTAQRWRMIDGAVIEESKSQIFKEIK